MIRLSKEEKEEIFESAKLRLETKIYIDWPLYIGYVSPLESFCSKCNSLFKKTTRKLDGCPVHGMSTNFGDLYYFHFEEISNEEFWIYKLKRTFDGSAISMDIKIEGLIVYKKEDAFYLKPTKRSISRVDINTFCSTGNAYCQVKSNIEDILSHVSFMEETGFIDFYTFEDGVNKNRRQKVEEIKKSVGMHRGHIGFIKVVTKTIDYHKRQFSDIGVLKSAGYSSLLEYMKEKGLYLQIKSDIVDGVNPIEYNLEAKSLNDLLNYDNELLEAISNDKSIDQITMQKLKFVFGGISPEDRRIVLEMIKSPIIFNKYDNINFFNFISLFWLNKLGYKTKDVWGYIKKINLYENIESKVISNKLAKYALLKSITEEEYEKFPNNLISEVRKIEGEYDERMSHFDRKIFELDFLSVDNRYEDGCITVEKLTDYEEYLSIKDEINNFKSNSFRKSRLLDLMSIYLIKRTKSEKDEEENLALVQVSPENSCLSVLSSYPLNYKDEGENKLIISFIKRWAKEKELDIRHLRI